MFLFEEYLTRNQIDIPYVKATNNSSVFYRHGDTWAILSLRYLEQGNHPGYHIARYMEPQGSRFDRYGNDRTGCTLRKVKEDDIVYWDNYQIYLTNWSKSIHKTDIAASELDARLAAWEICLQCFDTLLTPYANSELFFNTINLDLSPTKRYNYVEQMLHLIRREERGKNQVLAHFWEDDLANFYRNYATWLVKLVERYGC